jgi:hypothetical protein
MEREKRETVEQAMERLFAKTASAPTAFVGKLSRGRYIVPASERGDAQRRSWKTRNAKSASAASRTVEELRDREAGKAEAIRYAALVEGRMAKVAMDGMARDAKGDTK